MGINYLNASDKKKSGTANAGVDIFIHGECVTIGCLPMTNDRMKEIYLLAIQACQCGQHKIPVYIFQFKLTDEKHAAIPYHLRLPSGGDFILGEAEKRIRSISKEFEGSNL